MTKSYIMYGVFHDDAPEVCRYVGITSVSVKQRASSHWSFAKSNRSFGPMPSWLRKHAEERDRIKFVELESFESEVEMKAREIEYISVLRSIGQADLNLTDGGEGGNGWRHTPESKAKLSAAFSGANNPMFGVKRPELARYAQSFQGPKTKEQKAAISARSTAWWADEERRKAKAEELRLAWAEGRMKPITREKARAAAKKRPGALADGVPEKIVELRRQGLTYDRIAEALGVTRSQVQGVVGGAGSYIEGVVTEDWRVLKLRKSGLEVSDVHLIRARFDAGDTNKEIHESYPQVGIMTIRHITSRRGCAWVPETPTTGDANPVD